MERVEKGGYRRRSEEELRKRRHVIEREEV